MSNYYILKKYFFTFVIIFFTELYTYSMDGEYEEGNKECPVCGETISKDKKIVLPCGHFFCKGCCYDYIVGQIGSNIEKIYCMMCSNQNLKIEKGKWGSFTEEQCLGILRENGKENFKVLEQNYEMWKKRVEINSSNGTIKACPYKFQLAEGVTDCSGTLRKDEHNQYSTCNICNKEFCFKCLRNRDEHKEKSCEEYKKEMEKKDDEILLEVFGKNNIKKCPHCGLATHKFTGCNHIKCTKCNNEWCWVCNGKIVNPSGSGIPLHYRFGQCSGKQFDYSNEKIKKDCVGWMLYILCCDCIS